MRNFTLKILEPLSYNEREKKSQTFNILIAFGIFSFIYLLSDFKYGLFIAIFFFAVQYFKTSRWERCFITEIKLENQELLFKYKEENQEKEILGQQSDFKLIKEIALNKTRTIYLAVYFKGSLILKQFEVGEWNEGKIDEVIKQIAIV